MRRTAFPASPAGEQSQLPACWRGLSISSPFPTDPQKWNLKSISPGRAASLAESLSQRRDEAYLYRKLATLRDDVPLKETLNDLKWQGAYPRLKKLCHELGDDRIPERIPRWR